MPIKKLQSAMEYLMTYGWAILVIAVVLGALYQLGIFGSSTVTLQPSCLASTGFYCTSPIMNTTGFLGITFGQIGQQMTITNLACTKNSSTPISTQSVSITILSGSKTALQFSCPTSANSLGTTFKGYLWITYNSPNQVGIVDRFALVTGRIQTAGNVSKAQQAGGQGGTTTTSTTTTSSVSTTTIFTATGGSVTFSNGREIHTFTTSGTFTVTGNGGTVSSNVVGDGGGGGNGACNNGPGGGGGGSGGVSSNALVLITQAYTVTVGAGGGGAGSGSSFDGVLGGGGGMGANGGCSNANGGQAGIAGTPNGNPGSAGSTGVGGSGGASAFGGYGAGGAGGGQCICGGSSGNAGAVVISFNALGNGNP